MDEEFEAHRLKPGDEGWKYDNEVDFSNPQGGVIESSAWDDDDDDSDMEFWYVGPPCLPVRLYNISEPGSIGSCGVVCIDKETLLSLELTGSTRDS